MKALSLTQPWASLVACGAKRVETRNWYPTYRGPLAIHAAKGFPAWARLVAFENRKHLQLAGHTVGEPRGERDRLIHDLPLGAIIATCRLSWCERTETIAVELSEQERAFGDYTSGRYAWVLTDIVRLPEPIPARGALGLWYFAMPEPGGEPPS